MAKRARISIVGLCLIVVAAFGLTALGNRADGGRPAPAGTVRPSDEPGERAADFVITDPEELRKYAKEHGLSQVPVRVEGDLMEDAVEVGQ